MLKTFKTRTNVMLQTDNKKNIQQKKHELKILHSI